MSDPLDARFLEQLSRQIPSDRTGADEQTIRSAVETALTKASIDDPVEQGRIRDAVLGPAEAAGWKLDGLASALGFQASLATLGSKYFGETDLAARMSSAFTFQVYELPDAPLGLKVIPIVDYGDAPLETGFKDGGYDPFARILTHPSLVPTEKPLASGTGVMRDGELHVTHAGHYPLDYQTYRPDGDAGYPAMLTQIQFPDGDKPIEPADIQSLLAADVTFPADYQADKIGRLDLPAIQDVMDLATGFRSLAGKKNIKTRDLVAFAETVGNVFGTTLDQAGMRALKTQLAGATDDIAGYRSFVQSHLGPPEERDLGGRGPFMIRSLKQSLAAFAPE